MGVLVVGAGISGVACARELASRGVDVRVLERAHSVGGRLGVHCRDGRPADIGAAYFTVDDDEFGARVRRWGAAGLARPWTDRLAVFTGTSPGEATEGPMRWAAAAGLRSLVADLADGLPVELGREVAAVGPGPVVDGERADAVVVAMPDPQAERLIEPGSPAAAAVAGRGWNPVLSLVAGYPARSWPDLPAAFVNDHPALSLLADDGLRRGDGAPVLVAHSTPGLARRHDADPRAAAPEMTAAVAELLDLDEPPEWTHVHRWRFAAPVGSRGDAFHLGDDGIALAGDGWGRSRVQTAYLSGVYLGRALAERFS
ncbi:MAG: FAD-dependent oxidoreductase [Pseudonocardia sp.]|nr:FAD-dependent oxidoreductase [Pseudonocardia sp.]